MAGLAFFCGTIVFLRDHHSLERYRYTIAAASILLLMLPRLPGVGAQVNGAFLAIKLGPIQFQPAEFAKLGIIVFLASYLREAGRRPRPAAPAAAAVPEPGLSVRRGRARVADPRPAARPGAAGALVLIVSVVSLVAVIRERPSLKHFGPLLLVWGLAMLMLIVIRDLGSSLMFFGAFLALLYVATGRLALIGVGGSMFAAGSAFFASHQSHVEERVDIWLDPFKPGLVEDEGYQIAQSLFAQADGGLFGQGFGRRCSRSRAAARSCPLRTRTSSTQ